MRTVAGALAAVGALSMAPAAAQPLPEVPRPVIDDCAAGLPPTAQALEVVVELQAAPGRRGPDLDVRAAAAQVPVDAELLATLRQCLWRVLDLPDPKQRGASLRFGARVTSRAPGLDASVQADVDESGHRVALPMPPLTEPHRPTGVRCMQFIGGVVPRSELWLSLRTAAGAGALQAWAVRGADPGTLEGREAFQLHARCLTGALGTALLLPEVALAAGRVQLESR